MSIKRYPNSIIERKKKTENKKMLQISITKTNDKFEHCTSQRNEKSFWLGVRRSNCQTVSVKPHRIYHFSMM